MKKKLSIFFLILTLVFFIFPVSAFADSTGMPYMSSEEKALVNQKIASIKESYGITVTCADNVSNEGVEVIDAIDVACERLGATFLSALNDYYAQIGKSFKISLSAFGQSDVAFAGSFYSGYFNPQTATLSVFAPEAGVGFASFGDPTTRTLDVLHEFGHAFHYMAYNKYGYQNMVDDFVKLNNGVAYTKNTFSMGVMSKELQNVFVSNYAASAYSEDFADTFAVMFDKGDNRSTGASARKEVGNFPQLMKKYKYIESLVDSYISSDCVASKRIDNFLALADEKKTQ